MRHQSKLHQSRCVGKCASKIRERWSKVILSSCNAVLKGRFFRTTIHFMPIIAISARKNEGNCGSGAIVTGAFASRRRRRRPLSLCDLFVYDFDRMLCRARCNHDDLAKRAILPRSLELSLEATHGSDNSEEWCESANRGISQGMMSR